MYIYNALGIRRGSLTKCENCAQTQTFLYLLNARVSFGIFTIANSAFFLPKQRMLYAIQAGSSISKQGLI